MAVLVQISDLHHRLGGNDLFCGIEIVVNEADRIGLAGHNGSGKSTLLSLLAGQGEVDHARVHKRRGLRIGLVEQFLPPPLFEVNAIDAVAGEHWRSESLLSELGFTPALMNLAVGRLSGGQQNRLMFARAVVQEPDLLLLDEPTNHLDLATIVRFESYLKQLRCAFVLVSHDRAFLDAVTNRTWVLRDRRIYSFTGPYSSAARSLTQMDEAALRSRESEERKISSMRASAKRLSIWGKVYDNEKLARKAKNMERRVERMEERKTFVSRGSPLNLSVEVASTKAREVVRVSNLQVAIAGTKLFHIDDFLIRPGERVALLGHNGVGKSTFVRQLVGCQHENHAEIRFAPQTTFGYYDQELDNVTGEETMLAFACARVAAPEVQIKKQLIGAGFAYPDHGKSLSVLSGGERARLLFVVLSMLKPNFLILDEPTNHLDIEGKEQLEDALLEGGAAILITSHDRRFVDTVAERFVWIRNGRLEAINDPTEFYESGEESAFTRYELKTAEHDVEHDTLERIVVLEEKLEADRARKPKYQKPERQRLWLEELARLYAEL